MKRYCRKLKCVLILLSVILSFDIVNAKPKETASVESIAPEINEEESDMPEGGWSPMVGYRIEEKQVKEKSIRSFRRVINAPLDDVFAKGVGTNGYNALSSDGQRSYYTRINSAAVEFMESTDDLEPTQIKSSYEYVVSIIDYKSLGISTDEAFQALYAYDYDHPAYYWISNKYFYSDSHIYLCTEEEYASVSNRKSLNNKIIDGVNKYVAMTDKTDDVFEKIALVHDGIIADIDYAYEDDGKTPVDEKWAHSVQGVFDSNYGHAVCEGYSDAFSLIMNYLGIPNYYIVGHTAKGGGHAWNAVSDDGGATFMYMDLTWDDLGKDKGVFYKYFGMPSSNFEQYHIANSPSDTGVRWLYDINANLTNDFENTYYYKAGFYCSASDDCKKFAKLARIRAYRFGTVFSYLTDDMTVMGKVASEFNLNGQYSYYTIDYLDREYCLVIVSKIKDIDLSSAEIVLKNSRLAYTGEEIKPEIDKVTLDGIKLIKDDNYTVSYDNNIEVGTNTANVIVQGAGHFTGECSKAFSIVYEIKEDNVILSATEFTYDGTDKKPVVTVKAGNKTLIENTNYTVAFSENTTDAGTVTVTVEGIGEYEGFVEKNYTIEPASIADYSVSIEDGNWIYDGTPKEPRVISLKNEDFTIGADNYSVAYENNVNAGDAARVIVKGCGNYTGEISDISYTILPKEVTITGITAGNKIYDGTTDVVLDYSNVNLDKCGIIEGDKALVEAEGSYIDADAGVYKKVSISNIKLTGEDAGNYKLSSSGQQGETFADINTKPVTITALDQAVYPLGEVAEETATVSGRVSKEATCKDKGVTTYTATFSDESFITQTKDVCDIAVLTTHTPSLAVKENEESETCTENGSYDEVVYCSVCGAELDRNKVVIEAFGHEWSEWVVVTQATQTSEGLEERVTTPEKTDNIIPSDSGDNVLEYKAPPDATVKTVIVPDTQTIDGVEYEVTKLYVGAFAGNKTIEKVIIGSNIDSIGDDAFRGCTNLKSITIPKSVKEIGENAFADCTALTKVIIPAKVRKIKKNAFRNNKKLKTVIIKSQKLKSIGKNAFKNINKKATFYVPKKLTKKQYTKYKKMLKKSGISKSVKIKKK